MSLLYSALYGLSTRALVAAGLDPTWGLLHKFHYSMALVYDYSEMFKPIAVHTVIKTYREKHRLELDSSGELDKESMRILLSEFFKILASRIRGTKLTPYREIYVKAMRLSQRIRGQEAKYTYIYNSFKLEHKQ